jgi:hypothetical protein
MIPNQMKGAEYRAFAVASVAAASLFRRTSLMYKDLIMCLLPIGMRPLRIPALRRRMGVEMLARSAKSRAS